MDRDAEGSAAGVRDENHWTPLFERLTLSEKYADIGCFKARTFYVLLLTKVDDFGRFHARPRGLNAEVWPMLGQTSDDVLEVLRKLRDIGLIRAGDHEGEPFLEIVGHECRAGTIGKKDHRRASRFPDPSDSESPGPDWPALARTGPAPSDPAQSGSEWPSRAPAIRSQSQRLNQSPIREEGAARAPDEPAPSSETPKSGSAPPTMPRLVRDPEPERPPKARKPRAPATGDHAEAIRHWEREWQRTRLGTQYKIQPKDGAAVAQLLKLGPLAEVQTRATRLLESPDPWYAKKASLTFLLAEWNPLAVAMTPNAAPPSNGVTAVDRIMQRQGMVHL